jgi:hypothetical protein
VAIILIIIDKYFISGYWWILMLIILVVIGGYSINGYWWLLYYKLLWIIIHYIMIIGDYSIINYC